MVICGCCYYYNLCLIVWWVPVCLGGLAVWLVCWLRFCLFVCFIVGGMLLGGFMFVWFDFVSCYFCLWCFVLCYLP